VRLLLDTHVVLWQLQGTRAIGPHTLEAIERAEELRFSVVSFAEIGVKASIGKLVVPRELHAAVARSGLQMLGLAADAGLAVAELPLHHRDPFDRLLIAQARLEQLTIVTADRRFAEYDVSMIDAAL
jgi:PIN domain nuclease of toxin-antitoxin system